MRIEVDKKQLDDLELDKATFATALSAMVMKHGKYNKEKGRYEAKLYLPDLQAISESDMFVENQLQVQSPFTLIWVKSRGANGRG